MGFFYGAQSRWLVSGVFQFEMHFEDYCEMSYILLRAFLDSVQAFIEQDLHLSMPPYLP